MQAVPTDKHQSVMPEKQNPLLQQRVLQGVCEQHHSLCLFATAQC